MPGDTDLHALYDAAHDKDRHTEVGGPPTGQVPKVGQSVTNLPKAKTAETTVSTTRRSLWIVMLLLLAGAGAVALYFAMREKEPSAQTTSDGGIADAPKPQIRIDTEPEGASGFVEVDGDPKTRVPIPKITHASQASVTVPHAGRYHLHLELAGYVAYDDTFPITEGENIRLTPQLRVAPAKLDVTTDPPGVSITLAGRSLGDSPKVVENLAPAIGAVLVLAKSGFTTVTKTIDLRAGETLQITETLKAVEKFGFIMVTVEGAAIWGNVWFNGKSLGRSGQLSGPNRYKLPVGTGQLKVTPPNGGKGVTKTITVTEGVQQITVSL